MSTDASTNHHSNLHTTLDPRTQRALDEPMSVTTHRPGTYHVAAASGATYIVTLPSGTDDPTDHDSATCTCPDYAKQTPEEGCKHLRRVKLDVAFDELPHPDDCPTDTDLAERESARPTYSSQSVPSPVATDGGQTRSTAPTTTSPSISPDIAAGKPTVTREVSTETGLDTPRGISHRISERIQEIEYEIDQRRAELKDLETTLSVLEDLTPELNSIETGG